MSDRPGRENASRSREELRAIERGVGARPLIVIVLTGGAVLAWLLGRIVSDRFLWSQWLLWIPTPGVLLAVGLGFATVACSPRRARLRRPTLLILALTGGLLLASLLVFEHRFFRGAKADPAGLVLVQWTLSQDTVQHEHERIAEVMMEVDGDVTILTNAVAMTGSDQVRAWMGKQHEPARLGRFTIFTRLPVDELSWVVNTDDHRIARARIDARAKLGRSLTVYIVDLLSDPYQGKAAVAADLRHMLDEAGPPAPDAIVGDFNMTRGSAALRTLTPGFHHAFRDGGHGHGASFHRRFPLYHIDHVLLTDSLECERYDLVDPGVGRHRIQVAWLLPR